MYREKIYTKGNRKWLLQRLCKRRRGSHKGHWVSLCCVNALGLRSNFFQKIRSLGENSTKGAGRDTARQTQQGCHFVPLESVFSRALLPFCPGGIGGGVVWIFIQDRSESRFTMPLSNMCSCTYTQHRYLLSTNE